MNLLPDEMITGDNATDLKRAGEREDTPSLALRVGVEVAAGTVAGSPIEKESGPRAATVRERFFGNWWRTVPAPLRSRLDIQKVAGCGNGGPSFRRLLPIWLVLLLAGCMTTPPGSSTTSWRIGDQSAPLGAQTDQQTNRPLTPPPKNADPFQPPKKEIAKAPDAAASPDPFRKRKAPGVPKAKAPAGDDSDDPPQAISPHAATPGPALRGPALNGRKSNQLPLAEPPPQIVPAEVTVAQALELSVSGPSRKQVGGSATFYVRLTNAGDKPLEKLAVRCNFDDALVFVGSDKREVRQRVDRLAAGESKDLALSLTANSAGSHCCRFAATQGDGSDETEIVFKEVCVDFVTRHVEIEITGPGQRTEGSRAEFNITLSNKSLKTIVDTQAIISFDNALIPKEASADAEQKPGSLTWTLGTLKPLEQVELQVEFECRNQAHRACVAVEVKGSNLGGADGHGDQDEACLEILPVPGTLDLQIGDVDDPVEVGKTGTFAVTVENIGLQPTRGVKVEAMASEHLQIRSAKVLSGRHDLPLKYTIDGSRIAFDAVDALEPTVRLVFTIEVEALKPGPAEMRASLSSSLSSTPVTTAEPMSVVEP